MSRFRSARALGAGCGLVLAVNAVILALAAWNRSGQPTCQLTLTERELALPEVRDRENSVLFLRLLPTSMPPEAVRRVAYWRRAELPAVDLLWLDRAKMRELGFGEREESSGVAAERHSGSPQERRVLVVLEYEGEAWRSWIAGREEAVAKLRREVDAGAAKAEELADAEALLAFDRTMRSRLFPVDAGFDAAALRTRYPDSQRYVVVDGIVKRALPRPASGEPGPTGAVAGLLVADVRVPPEFGERLEGLVPEGSWEELQERARAQAKQGWPQPTAPRYRATISFGRRLEPWLDSVEQ